MSLMFLWLVLNIGLDAPKLRLKAKSTGASKVRPIAYDYISVDSILFDPSVQEIFYFIHDVGASNAKNFNNFYWQSCLCFKFKFKFQVY